MRLLLFDIDGTLLHCGPQVRPLFAAALEEVYGTTGTMDGYSFAGKTDPRIVLDLMTGAGVPEPEVQRGLPAMRQSYLDRLEAGLDAERMALLPGVVDLLARLTAEGEVTVGLVTGNWERGARIKLSRFGLDRYFAFGAFGDDGVGRAELPPVALARAEHHTGRRFTPDEILIIGDTTEDVACARAHSFHCLGVATGWTPAAALREAGAGWVADDLPAAGRLLPLLACGG